MALVYRSVLFLNFLLIVSSQFHIALIIFKIHAGVDWVLVQGGKGTEGGHFSLTGTALQELRN